MPPLSPGRERAGALLALLLSACASTPRTPEHLVAALAANPSGHLSGTPVALGPPLVLNREDFVWDAKLSPRGDVAALSRLGMQRYHLALHDLSDGGVRFADTAINPLEFDVEALEFSPDGAHVATVSRDGALRVFSARDGTPELAWLTDEPLTAVAWHGSGGLLSLGSARGLLTLVSFPRLEHLAELRAHADEVRGLAFTPAGELVSASWDRRLLVSSVAAAASPPRELRAHFEKRSGQALVRAVLDRAVSVSVALDARAPVLLVRPAAAQAAGIDALTLSDSMQVPTQFGVQVVKVARGRALSIKGLTFEQVDVAVCEACVPPDAQAVLGGPLLRQLEPAFDEAAQELVLTVPPSVSLGAARQLTLARGFTLPAAINDLSLDASGAVAGLALSETKAQRTREVYDREQRGLVEPERPWDCGARVELATGRVLERLHGHRGVVASAALSPDGRTLATAGWDRRVILHGRPPAVAAGYGRALRRVRFSRDGRKLVVGAWTPQNPLGDHQSDPAAVVYEVIYREAVVR